MTTRRRVRQAVIELAACWFVCVAQISYRGYMTSQPRHQTGATQQGVSTAGRWMPKAVPTVDDTPVGFNTEGDAVGPVCDWDKRTVRIWGTETVFERTVRTDAAGNQVASVAMDCDDPSMMLLARKGDGDYWRRTWSKNNRDRRMWCADIACRMLNDGHVATGLGTGDATGIKTAMTAAGSPVGLNAQLRDTFTYAVAQLRGLRLIQSMTPGGSWNTRFGGKNLPHFGMDLLGDRYRSVARVCGGLRQPPWDDTDPPGVQWGPQVVAGYATTTSGDVVFVGEHGDLPWRALTETDYYGRSPLKHGLAQRRRLPVDERTLIVAAVLYDETAAAQLTTGLFAGYQTHERVHLQNRVRDVFQQSLNPGNGSCLWTDEQQHRLRGFIETVEALQP